MKVVIITTLIASLSMGWDCETIYDYDNSKEVFIGTVIKLQFTEDKSEVIASLDVQQIYKKDESHRLDTLRNVEVKSHFGIAKGHEWDLGKTYLVFVENIASQYRIVNMCSLTTEIKGYKYDETGEWIGTPSVEEVRDWWVNGNEKWNKKLNVR